MKSNCKRYHRNYKEATTCKCKCKYLIIHSPQGFLGIIYNTGWGTLPECLTCSLKVMKEWVVMRDAPIHECESEIDHYTGHYVPYSLWRVCGFFNVPQIYYMCKGLWDGAYGLSSLSEKTRKSNRLQMLLQTALSPQLFKDPEFWSCWGLNLRPPAQPTGAYPIELTGWRLT